MTSQTSTQGSSAITRRYPRMCVLCGKRSDEWEKQVMVWSPAKKQFVWVCGKMNKDLMLERLCTGTGVS